MLRNTSVWNCLKTVAFPQINYQQVRNTFILKRRHPPPLTKKGFTARKMKNRHFIYDLVEDTTIKPKPKLDLILTDHVTGLGERGDIVSLTTYIAHNKFLLPGLAVYPTPENKEKYKKDEVNTKSVHKYSSVQAEYTLKLLSKTFLNISMSKTHPWILEPWHIRVAFRKIQIVVPDYAIEMPPGKIQGPDLSLNDKEFFVTVTINKTEKVNVLCRIYHWPTPEEELPFKGKVWKIPYEPLFPEQAEILSQIDRS